MVKSLFCGDLVRLTAPRPEDHEIMAHWTEDAEYTRQLDTSYAKPSSRSELDEQLQGFLRGGAIIFYLRTVAEDRFIGFVALHDIEWNNQVCTLSVGIGDPDFRGKGFGSDALRLVLNYAFNELNLYRVGLDVIGDNARAIHAYEKAGFKREGAWRGAVKRDGQRVDRVSMGILREEWQG